MKKRILNILLCLCMMVTLLPAGAFAEGASGWDGTTDTTFSGARTENDPYIISTAAELAGLAEKVNQEENYSLGKYYKLTADIDLNPGYTFTFEPDTGLVAVAKSGGSTVYLGTDVKGDTSGDNTTFDTTASTAGVFYASAAAATTTTAPAGLLAWTPIGNQQYTYLFQGVFNGNGKTVSGLYFNSGSTNFAGLFGKINVETDNVTAGINNITVTNSYVYGKWYVGGVCGLSSEKIENCRHTGIVIGTKTATTAGGESVGGVCGYNWGGTIDNCQNTGTVLGGKSVGGVCGYNTKHVSDGVIRNCDNTGTVTGSDSRVGGICGVAGTSTKLESCHNTGAVTGNSSVGGVFGSATGYYNIDTIKNCYNTGAVTGSGNNIGGVGGSNGIIVKNCYNTGKVTGSSKSIGVGGVCGTNSQRIENCYYLTETAAGGINGADAAGSAEANSSTQFTDGTVAWLLNTAGKNVGETDYSHTGVWSQGNASPVFADETHKTTYKITIAGEYTGAAYSGADEKAISLPAGYVLISEGDSFTADTSVTGDITVSAVYDGLRASIDKQDSYATVSYTVELPPTGWVFIAQYDGSRMVQLWSAAVDAEHSSGSYSFNQVSGKTYTYKVFLISKDFAPLCGARSLNG